MGNRLSRIYTRTGDDGTTGLGDGARVDKDAPRVEAYGTVDEANSAVGLVLAVAGLPPAVAACLTEVQHDLFDVGAELCIPGHRVVTDAYTTRLERNAPPSQGVNASTANTASAPVSHWAEQVVLGSSSVELNGPWKFHKGDDLQWAQPDFNDSGWPSMDLTPPPGSYDPFLGSSGFMPGWTALGDSGYAGYAWYRLKVNVQYDPGLSEGGLEIKMPDDVDDAYQVFVNGQLIGEFGHFTPSGVRTYLTLPRTFALPRGIKSGQITFAIRVWMDPSTALTNPDAGGLHGPPILGQAGPIERMLRLDWDAVNRSQLNSFLELALLLLAIIVAAVLFWLDRKEKAYLWLGLACTGVMLQTIVSLVGNYSAVIPGSFFFMLSDAILSLR